MTGATDASATLTMAYDNDGRLTTMVTSGPGYRPADGDADLRLRPGGGPDQPEGQLVEPGGDDVHLRCDQRVTSITQSFGGTAGPQLTYGYDNGSRLTSISRQIGSGTPTQVNTTIVYDAANRVRTITDGVHLGWLGIARPRWRPTFTATTTPAA